MQESFGFAMLDLLFMRRALAKHSGVLEPFRRRTPVWQLIRSMAGIAPKAANAHFKSRGIAPRVPPFPGGPLSAVERQAAACDPPNLIRLTPA